MSLGNGSAEAVWQYLQIRDGIILDNGGKQ